MTFFDEDTKQTKFQAQLADALCPGPRMTHTHCRTGRAVHTHDAAV